MNLLEFKEVLELDNINVEKITDCISIQEFYTMFISVADALKCQKCKFYNANDNLLGCVLTKKQYDNNEFPTDCPNCA